MQMWVIYFASAKT